ncbi:MAG: hypothetical protein VYA79_01685 [Candidatus Thermoplasmatota archaeon]|nr:hypothetical protein [Candidatus Thermoplasmatota archaeon]
MSRDGITAKMLEQWGHNATTSFSPTGDTPISLDPPNHEMNEGLFIVGILLNDVIPRSTYNPPIMTEGPVKIIKNPSVMKHIPRQPKEIVLMKIPAPLRNLKRTEPSIEIGTETNPSTKGNMKKIEFS